MSRSRILIVEDEAIVALDIEERLTGMGYELAGHASNGEDALALVRAGKPDLVLMDIQLQGSKDGIAVAEEIHRLIHLPVIFLTAYSEEATLDRAKLAEPYGYILKPFDDRELKSAIEIALYKHASENEIRRMNRLYDVLSQVNQLILRTTSREDLLQSVCRLVVERGAVDLAWIGCLDAGTSRILPIASFGIPAELIEQSIYFADDRPEGQGNPGKAIRTGQPFICDHCGEDACMYPAALAPARFGCQSCAAFPLRFEGQVCGVLSLYVSEPEYFLKPEVDLLTEVAMDISFALDKIKGDEDRRLAEEARQESEARYQKLFEEATVGIALADADTGEMLDCNLAFARMSEYDRAEVIGMPQRRLHPERNDDSPYSITFEQHREEKEGAVLPATLLTRSGSVKQVEVKANILEIDGRRVALGFFRDITAELRHESEREMTLKLFRLMNEETDDYELIRGLTGLLQDWTGCEAVGIRLHEGNDFPYFESRGFSAEFVRLENQLCAHDEGGVPVLDDQGRLVYECMCGKVIDHRIDKDLPCFTAMGNFWTNSTTDLLASGGGGLEPGTYRNRCVGEGYESLALIALRHGPETLGLLQFNDRRRDLFTPELIIFLEGTADQIAIALTQRQTRNALRASEERYRALFETAAEAIVVAQDGMLMFVNRAAEVVSGYSREELISRPFVETLFHPDDRERVAANYELRVSGDSEAQDDEYRIIKSDGTVSWLRITTAMMLWQGRPATLNMCTDITRQIRQEREIKLLNRLYAVLSHVGQAVLWAKDVKGFLEKACRIVVEDGDFILAWIGRVDPGTGKIEPAAVWGAASDHATAVSALTDDDWADNDPVRVCIREQRAVVCNDFLEDGHARPWLPRNGLQDRGSTAAFPIKSSDEIWGALMIHAGEAVVFGEKDVQLLEEVTGDIGFALNNLEKERQRQQTEEEKDHLEAQLVQAQKMESVGRLAGGVAHDFNNALSVIIGYAEMALTGLETGHPLYRHLKEIQDAGHRSAALTRQLLAFARKQTIHPRLLDLNTAVSGSIKMLQRLIGENIALEWRPGAHLRPVKIDPSQLDQILANMAVNARDAIDGVGRVVIRTANVTLDETFCVRHIGCDPGQYVMMSISDDGAGMTRDVLEKIFEPFFTTKEMGKGTGLGLATVFGIIKQNNGYIEVASEPGKGTAFKIYLPACDDETEEPQLQTKARRLRGGNETILLVDDARQILDIGKMMLERLGYTVIAAPMPSQAIEVARQYSGPIHLLITDVIMPEMNGRDLMVRVHEIHPEMRGIYMSGYTADVIASEGILDEGLHFIQKPYRPEELAELIRDVLEQS